MSLAHIFANGDEEHGISIDDSVAQQNLEASTTNIRNGSDRRWRVDVRYLVKVKNNRRTSCRRQPTGE